MNTRNLMRKLPSCLLGAIFVAGVSSTTVNAIDGAPPSLFELDGNTQDGVVDTNPGLFPSAGTDWDVLHAGNVKPDNLIAFTGVLPDPTPKTIFWKGGSKDVSDVSEWWFKEGAVSDKSDITNAYAAAFTNPEDVCFVDTDNDQVPDTAVACPGDPDALHKKDDLIVYFGMDRFDNSGDTFGGFWFFQDPAVGLPLDQNGNVLSSGEFSGTHFARRFNPLFPNDLSQSLPGDVLVLVEYPQANGAQPIIKVYEWDPDQLLGTNTAPNLALLFSSDKAQCDGSGGKLACAIVNLVTLPNPDWDYRPKGGSATSDMPTQTFFEGGINLTAILGTTPCISSFLAESRSSRSETASLEDFAFGDFDACGANVTKSCESVISTNGSQVTVTFFGEASNTGGLPLKIELEDFVFVDSADQNGTPGISEFTKVCFDAVADGGNGNGRCDEEANIGGLTLAGSTASFTLNGGKTVVYEGVYVLTQYDETTPFTDKVIMSFFDPSTGVLIDTEEAISAECPPTGRPDIDVTKACSNARVVDGSTFVADITGTVVNTGNVKLVNVTLSDTDFSPPALTVVRDSNGNGVVDVGEPVFGSGGDLAVGAKLAYKATVSSTTPSHSNTMTVNGTNTFDATVTVSDFATATCEPALTRGLTIVKDCDPAYGGGSGVRLVVDNNNQVVVQVGNIITVTNTGNEDLKEVLISDSEVQSLSLVVTVPPTGAGLTCKAANEDPLIPDAHCKGTLDSGEVVTFKQTYKPDGGSITGDLAFPSGLSFDNIASAQGKGVLSNVPIGPFTDDAKCVLCP